MIVAIPAHNEESRIARTLQALGTQRGEWAGQFSVLVLANNCSDATAQVARTVARTLPVTVEVVEEQFATEQAHVGHARGRVLQLAAARLMGHPHGLIATTDADTVAAPDWASRMRRALVGADVVGGRILTLPEESVRLPQGLRRLQLQDAAYHLLASQLSSRLDPDPADPWPRHHQHFGANLGLRLSAWQQVKVWPPVRTLEDLALVEELRRLDLRLRHCPQVKVWTSARQSSRVEVGLSSQLREWQEFQSRGRLWMVPGAEELRRQAEAGAALSRSWNEKAAVDTRLEPLWMVGPGDLEMALSAPTLGQARELAMHARHRAGQWAAIYAPVPLVTALHDLRKLLARP